MLFFYWIKWKIIKESEILWHECPACNKQDWLLLWIKAKYFHFYFIPMFFSWNDKIIVCTRCNEVFKTKQLNKEIQDFVKTENSQAKTPKYYYTWGFLFLSLIVYYIWLITYNSYYGQ